MNTPENNQRILTPNRIMALAATTAAVAFTGCANQQNQSPESQAPDMSLTAATTRAKTVPPEDCSFHSVDPGKYFTPSRSSKLNQDLTVLKKIHTPDAKIGFRDGKTAAFIVRYSFKDPLYSSAIIKANHSIERGKKVTVKSFLGTKVRRPKMCEDDDHHISKKDASAQYRQATSIGQTLIKGIGVKVKDQGSSFAERGLDTLKETFNNLKDSYSKN